MSMNGALVRHTYPDSMLGRGVGLNGLVVSIAAAVAPSLAAGILAVGPWPWLFAVNVPFGLLNTWLALRYLPALRDRAPAVRRRQRAPQRGDVRPLLRRRRRPRPRRRRLDRRPRRSPAPWRRARCWSGGARGRPRRSSRSTSCGNPVFALSVTASICAFVAFIIAFVALPFHFESALGLDQVQTGLLMTPWPVALGLAAPLAGHLSDRIPAGTLGAFGMLLLAVGLALMSRLPAEATAFGIAWRMALCGLGFGFFQAPNNRAMLAAAPRSRSGAAGGMLAMARLLGMTAGAAMTALVFHFAPGTRRAGQPRRRHRLRDRGGRGEPPPPLPAGIAGLRRGRKSPRSACWQGR